jgi:hypothetical protein
MPRVLSLQWKSIHPNNPMNPTDTSMKTSSSHPSIWKRTAVLGSVCVLSASLVAFTAAKEVAASKAEPLHIQVSDAPLLKPWHPAW